MSLVLAGARRRFATILSLVAIGTVVAPPARAATTEDSSAEEERPASPRGDEPPGFRWGLGLAGGVGGGYLALSETSVGEGGAGGGLVGELGGAVSKHFSIYWAPQVYVTANAPGGISVTSQNAAIFEWSIGNHFAMGFGPSIDVTWWGPNYGPATTVPMLGIEGRATVTFGARDGEPRPFVGAMMHASTLAVAGFATASLAVGVHAF